MEIKNNLNFIGMDELDEFNEAPHIVHGDTILPSAELDGQSVDLLIAQDTATVNSNDTNYLINNCEISTDLLNGDDFLINGNIHYSTQENQRYLKSDSNLLNLNVEAVDLNKNSHIVA